MFPTITPAMWKTFWMVIDEIERADTGGERERYMELWRMADAAGSYSELETVIGGLNDTAGEVEPQN